MKEEVAIMHLPFHTFENPSASFAIQLHWVNPAVTLLNSIVNITTDYVSVFSKETNFIFIMLHNICYFLSILFF